MTTPTDDTAEQAARNAAMQAAVADLARSGVVKTRETPPNAEREFVPIPGTGALLIDGQTGLPMFQPDLPPLEGPEQVYRDVPADAIYTTDAGRAKAEGWQVPFPALDECLRQREALRVAVIRAKALRAPDPGALFVAVRHAAELTEADPAAAVLDAIVSLGVDTFLTLNLGQRDSVVSSVSYQLETRWTELVHANQRAIIASLIGRDSPACNRLRSFALSMDRHLTPPTLGYTDWVVF